METAKHTPTPWEISPNIGRKNEIGVIADGAPCIIAVMGNQDAWPVMAEANARFIVQACNNHEKLVKTLKTMVRDYAHCAPDADGKIDSWRQALIEEARAALAETREEG